MRFPLIVLFLISTACGRKESPAERKIATAPVVVQTAVAGRVSLPSAYEASGTVRARVSATVSAKLMGYAREVRAQTGDRVAEGQTLVILDARDQQAAVIQAEANRDEVRSAIPEADSAIAGAKAQVNLAQATFQRMQELLEKRSVTRQEFDEASARLQAAQSSLDAARSRRAQFDAKLAQVEQAVRTAGIQQTYTTIAAPFSGVILSKTIEPGTLVTPGSPLFTMEREGGFRLEANVEQSRLGAVRMGQPVKVTVDDRTFSARVSEVLPAVDAASRTGIVKIDLPAASNLRSGLFGRAEFAAGTREALAVPRESVVERGQLQSVFVIEGGVARTRLVTLGAAPGTQIEVLSGLKDGETIVVAPVPASLVDGAAVEVLR